MGLLTIIYWVLLVLVCIGTLGAPEWPWWPRANAVVIVVLFIILGLKLVKPNW
jgi:hypothetical protein